MRLGKPTHEAWKRMLECSKAHGTRADYTPCYNCEETDIGGERYCELGTLYAHLIAETIEQQLYELRDMCLFATSHNGEKDEDGYFTRMTVAELAEHLERFLKGFRFEANDSAGATVQWGAYDYRQPREAQIGTPTARR